MNCRLSNATARPFSTDDHSYLSEVSFLRKKVFVFAMLSCCQKHSPPRSLHQKGARLSSYPRNQYVYGTPHRHHIPPVTTLILTQQYLSVELNCHKRAQRHSPSRVIQQLSQLNDAYSNASFETSRFYLEIRIIEPVATVRNGR